MVLEVNVCCIIIETAMGHPKTHDDREGYEYAMAVMK